MEKKKAKHIRRKQMAAVWHQVRNIYNQQNKKQKIICPCSTITCYQRLSISNFYILLLGAVGTERFASVQWNAVILVEIATIQSGGHSFTYHLALLFHHIAHAICLVSCLPYCRSTIITQFSYIKYKTFVLTARSSSTLL